MQRFRRIHVGNADAFAVQIERVAVDDDEGDCKDKGRL
jgi:hypothetical protein